MARTRRSAGQLDLAARRQAAALVRRWLAGERTDSVFREWPKSDDPALEFAIDEAVLYCSDAQADQEFCGRYLLLLESEEPLRLIEPPKPMPSCPISGAGCLAQAVFVAGLVFVMFLGLPWWLSLLILATLAAGVVRVCLQDELRPQTLLSPDDYRAWPFSSVDELARRWREVIPICGCAGDPEAPYSIGARAQAIADIEECAAGRLSLKDLVRWWPDAMFDPALGRIRDALGNLAGGWPLPKLTADVLTRCRLFVLSEQPYMWGRLFSEGVLVVFLAVLVAGTVTIGGIVVVSDLPLQLQEAWFKTICWIVFLVIGVAPWLAVLILSVLRVRWAIRSSLAKGPLRFWPFPSQEALGAASGSRGE